MALRIEDYALIGDCETAALVGCDGSLDWLCWPRFDSAACFAALLGGPEHGRWRIAPGCETRRVRRHYRDGTLVLETQFETAHGTATLVDFMPIRGVASDVVRCVRGESGQVPICMDLVIRFDYGRIVPWVSRLDDGSLRAVAGPHALVLRTPMPLQGRDFTTVSEFTISAGQTVSFVLTYQESHLPVPGAVDPDAALRETEEFWRDWSGRCNRAHPWPEPVIRSLITIKALTYRPTGGTVAAPTTSLPERLGGNRNWDYRYCWLRDAAFMLLSLMRAGYADEAEAWRDWLLRAVAGMPQQIQPLYGIAGEHRLDEWEVPWLPGHHGSRPVRIGNAAYGQFQLDSFGEVMDALHESRSHRLDPTEAGWNLQKELVKHLETVWDEPDEGIWEVRGGRQRFTHSKVLAWVAFDRAVKGVETFGLDGPVEHWRMLRERIHAEVCDRGFDPKRGAFVQAFGSDTLDASALLIPLVGFLPADDPRVRGTVAAVERELMVDGFVLRYDTGRTADGLPPGEGAFLACTFWLAETYALQGRAAEARRLFERLLAIRNDVGLLAEEYDPHQRRFLGNFPQALSHLALVDAAFQLHRGRKRR